MKRIITLSFLLLAIQFTFAQNLEINDVTDFATTIINECGDADTLKVDLINCCSADPLENVTLAIDLPDYVEYVDVVSSSDLNGVNDGDVTFPVFNFGDLAYLDTIHLAYLVRAQCGANSESLLEPLYDADYGLGGGTQYESGTGQNLVTYIKKPSIQFEAVENILKTDGVAGQSFTRSYKVYNTGLFSTLNGFEFESSVEAGAEFVELSVNGQVVSPQVNGTTITYFVNERLGNIDDFPSDEVIIEETILVTGCTDPNSGTISYVRWGCDGGTCEEEDLFPNIQTPTGTPAVAAILEISELPACWDDLAEGKITFTNNGTGVATDVTYTINNHKENFDQNYILENSFEIQLENGSRSSLTLDSATEPYPGPPCYSGGTLNSQLTFVIPFIFPGETYTVYFDYQRCVLESPSQACNNRQLFEHWYGSGEFGGTCNFPITAIPRQYLNSGEFHWTGSFSDGTLEFWPNQVGSFEITYSDGLLEGFTDDGSGYVQIEIDLPPGLCLSGQNDFEFRQGYSTGVLPLDVDYNQSTGIIILKYPTGSYNSHRLNFNAEVCCDAPDISFGWQYVTAQASFVPSGGCSSVRHYLNCEFNTPIRLHCPVPGCTEGGMRFLSFTTERTTFGEADNDDNGQADGGSLDHSLIRKDRLMIDDEFESVFTGVIETTAAPNPQSFEYGYASTNMPVIGESVIILDAAVRIYDSSTGTTYTCSNLPMQEGSSGSGKTWNFDYSPASLINAGCNNIPSGFVFENGDSIIINSNYKLTGSFSGTKVDIFNTNFYVSTIPDPSSAADRYQCENYTRRITAFGYSLNNLGNLNHTLEGCGYQNLGLEYIGSYYNSFYIGDNSGYGSALFPYEFRQLAAVGKMEYEVPTGYELESINVTLRQNTGSYSSQAYTREVFPSQVSGTMHTFDFSKLYAGKGGDIPIPDDGFRIFFSPKLRAVCDAIPQSGSLEQTYTNTFLNDNTLTRTGTANFQMIGPNLLFSLIGAQIQDGVDKVESFDIKIINNASNSPAEYVFFGFESNPNIQVDSVYNVTSGQWLVKNSDFWEVGDIAAGGSSVRLRLYTSYTICDLTYFDIFTGWDCGTYPSNAANNSCGITTTSLGLSPIHPELQVAVKNKALVYSDLCETIDYTVSVSNRDPGVATDLFLDLKLPFGAGVSYIPGHSKITYQGTDYNAEPTKINDYLYRWDVSDIVNEIEENGLRPYGEKPDNEYLATVRVASGCGFISGSTVQFESNATEICGRPLKAANDATYPIVLNSAANLNQVYVPLMSQDTTDRSRFRVMMINLSPETAIATSSNDHFYLSIPQGYTYTINSTSFSQYEPSAIEPTITEFPGVTRLEWDFADDIPTNDTMIWDIQFEVDSAAIACDIVEFFAQTVTELQDVCIATGETCGVFAESKDQLFYFSNCEGSGTGKMSGLESNGSLASKIALRDYKMHKTGKRKIVRKKDLMKFTKQNVKSGAVTANSLFKSGSSNILDFIPERAIYSTKAYVSTPEDLVNITNAVEVFAVDYFKRDTRMGAILATATQFNVYEHTKTVCDRLSGASLENIEHVQIQQYPFLMYTLKQEDGTIEYGVSFVAQETTNNELLVDNHWINEQYDKGELNYNFQVWASSPELSIDLADRVLRMMGQNQTLSFANQNLPNRPRVFVKQGGYENGQLWLAIQNEVAAEELTITGTLTRSETGATERFTETIPLSGETSEMIYLDKGGLYDIGLSLRNEVDGQADVIYAADGTWFLDYTNTGAEVLEYKVQPAFIHADNTSHINDTYLVERDIQLQGNVKEYLAIVRNLKSRNRTIDVSNLNELVFTAKGSQAITITLAKAGISNWNQQYRRTINLSEELKEYRIPLTWFSNETEEKLNPNDLLSMSFTVKGNGEFFEPVNLQLSNIYFAKGEEPMVILNDPSEVVASPNPATTSTNISFYLEDDSPLLIEVFNKAGQKTASNYQTFFKGQNQVTMNVEDYPAGIYMVVLTSNFHQRITKIVVE